MSQQGNLNNKSTRKRKGLSKKVNSLLSLLKGKNSDLDV